MTTTIPLTITATAQTILDSAIGQDFQRSIVEDFSEINGVESIDIATTQDAEHLAIDINHQDTSKNHRFYLSDPRQEGFDAAVTAKDLSRLYREFTLKEVNSMKVERKV